jgi:hypothetical protein
MKSIELYWAPFGYVTVEYTKQGNVRNVEAVSINGDNFKDLLTEPALDQVRNLMEQEIDFELSDDPEWEDAA